MSDNAIDDNGSDQPPNTREDDFPYYNGLPVNITGGQWWFVMGMTLIGFALLVAPIPFYAGDVNQFIPAILFFAIPLAGLIVVAPGHWKANFRPVGIRAVLWMFAIAILNIGVSMLMGYFVVNVFGATPNPASDTLANATTQQRLLFLAKTLPQLFGEELITILPFLALMYYFHSKQEMSRKKAILLAWVISAVIFGLAHLHTYDWNFVQCVVIIGTARLVLSLAYLKTKNIWVSTGAHVLNDWVIFGFAILGASQ